MEKRHTEFKKKKADEDERAKREMMGLFDAAPDKTTTKVIEKYPIQLSDLAIYCRYFISQSRIEKDFNIFSSRAKVLPYYNRVQICRDYNLLVNIKAGEGRPDQFGIFEGINS